MKATVKKEGLLIPKRFLKGVETVEIKLEKNRLVVLPVRTGEDPIFALGSHPGRSGLKDASINHDKYIYGRDYI
ncbi:MAG: hypothetical protein Q8K51_14705 [Nitrospirota bacterium]|nr:hypothetical protein [Nitrospirota bacterium]